MAKKTKRRSTPPTTEPRAVEALTVAWCLSVITVFLCDLGSACAWFYLRVDPGAERMQVLAGLLLFAAVVTGVVALVLIPVVCRLRSEPPPRGFLVFAVLVSVAPLIALALWA